ncbi:siphovirus ReqiPepy6 Gp37-like family protein [Clostridium sp. WILCCON 0269]|uniref:Siphovirus ReqiPepy6 Gp37-like family protein n=1 Tax=Candidatus Clostridium eludens TaxID=3381663 RepID=A0ABW8SM76_9CLOT
MPIRIIDKDFNLLGEIDDYESLQFIRRFYKVGEFELHINVNKNNTDMLQEDNLILLGSSFNKVGIIMHRENSYDQNGEPTDALIIKGATLKGIMARRLIVPPVNGNGYDSQTGSIETILKAFVNNHVVNPTDIARKIPQVTIAQDQQRGNQDKWRSRFEVLSDKLDEIGEYATIGWDVTLDITNNTWVFDVIVGRNLTVNQDTLPPVIFSVDFNSINSRHYISSSLNAKNVGYAGGKGDDVDRLIQQIGEVEGLARIETFLDCSQAEDVTELTTQGQQKLDELQKVESLEVGIIPEGSFVYGQDYDLGDFITAQDRKLGITMNAQIIELKEIYETTGFSLEGTFGTNIPTLLTILKKNTKQIVR